MTLLLDGVADTSCASCARGNSADDSPREYIDEMVNAIGRTLEGSEPMTKYWFRRVNRVGNALAGDDGLLGYIQGELSAGTIDSDYAKQSLSAIRDAISSKIEGRGFRRAVGGSKWDTQAHGYIGMIDRALEDIRQVNAEGASATDYITGRIKGLREVLTGEDPWDQKVAELDHALGTNGSVGILDHMGTALEKGRITADYVGRSLRVLRAMTLDAISNESSRRGNDEEAELNVADKTAILYNETLGRMTRKIGVVEGMSMQPEAASGPVDMTFPKAGKAYGNIESWHACESKGLNPTECGPGFLSRMWKWLDSPHDVTRILTVEDDEGRKFERPKPENLVPVNGYVAWMNGRQAREFMRREESAETHMVVPEEPSKSWSERVAAAATAMASYLW